MASSPGPPPMDFDCLTFITRRKRSALVSERQTAPRAAMHSMGPVCTGGGSPARAPAAATPLDAERHPRHLPPLRHLVWCCRIGHKRQWNRFRHPLHDSGAAGVVVTSGVRGGRLARRPPPAGRIDWVGWCCARCPGHHSRRLKPKSRWQMRCSFVSPPTFSLPRSFGSGTVGSRQVQRLKSPS